MPKSLHLQQTPDTLEKTPRHISTQFNSSNEFPELSGNAIGQAI